MKRLAGLNKANIFTPNSKYASKDTNEESYLAKKHYLSKNEKIRFGMNYCKDNKTREECRHA